MGIGRKNNDLITPIALLELIKTILHEVIHKLFPDFSEMDVEDKATEWLNSFDWGILKLQANDWGRDYPRPVERSRARI